jgi:exonuclease SbcC
MIVREVRLENVKSYASPAEIVRFNRGVNAICGPNGAGKTTILEAIGCALFQHLPYRHEEFVREGETTGTVTVVVESRRDQRIYEVVRKVGRGATHYIYDPDISQRVAHGEGEVRRWLHDHLRLDEEVDLRSLFLDSVGPPQGTLTAVFLESPVERRSKFNRLLRVEEYEEAYRKLGALESALADEQADVKLAIAGLEPQTRNRAALESQRAEVRDRQFDLVKQLQRSLAERAALEREIEAIERAARAWQTAESDLKLALERERSAEEILDRARAEYERASEARETCTRTQPGHDEYVLAMERLRALEVDQRERDRLRQERHTAELEAQRHQNEVGRLEGEIARAQQAARDAADLQAKIPEQEAAEKRLQAARDAKSESEQLRKRIVALEGQRSRMRDRIDRAEKEVAHALDQHAVADELPARRANHQKLADELAVANRAEGELKALREAVAQGQQRASRLQKQVAELDALIVETEKVEEQARALVVLETEHRQVADKRAAAASHLEHARATRVQVAGGLCPFLHEACRNLRPGVTLETHFDAEIASWSAELGRLDRRLGELDRQLTAARDATKRVAALSRLREQREQVASDLKDNAARLADSQQKLQAVAQLATRRTEAERAEQAAQRLVREAERAAMEISRLSDLRKALADAQRDREANEGEITAAEARLAELKGAVADLQAAVATLNALNSPREKAAHLLAEAAKLSAFQDQHERVVAERDKAMARVAEIDRSLEPYRDLDRNIEDFRRRRDNHRPDYEAFASASVVAQAIEERTKALHEAESQVTLARDGATRARHAMEEAARSYDQPTHQRALQRREELDKAIGDVQARSQEVEREQDRLDREIEKIDRLELELAAHRRHLDQIDDDRQLATTLRQSIRSAGPEITRQLLIRISRMASRINAEVLNQSGVELEWTPDYEIVTKRQGETRGFAQLSGGEQMAAALAVRLAILRDLSNVRVAFLDEPTAHLDQERRSNLGDQVQRLQGFDQLIVISHDDTFDGLFGHVIRIGRENGRSHVLDQN